jgi:hypothetical protein
MRFLVFPNGFLGLRPKLSIHRTRIKSSILQALLRLPDISRMRLRVATLFLPLHTSAGAAPTDFWPATRPGRRWRLLPTRQQRHGQHGRHSKHKQASLHHSNLRPQTLTERGSTRPTKDGIVPSRSHIKRCSYTVRNPSTHGRAAQLVSTDRHRLRTSRWASNVSARRMPGSPSSLLTRCRGWSDRYAADSRLQHRLSRAVSAPVRPVIALSK